MNALIIIGFYLACFHVIYEMILLPSFRHVLRFRLFALRDRLRTLRWDHGHQLDAEVFGYIDESLTWQMNNQHRLSVALLFDLPKLEQELHAEIQNRLEMITRCQLPEFVRIRKDAGKLLMLAFIANAGAWFIYLLPIALILSCYEKFRELLRKLIVIPERDLDKLAQGHEA